MDAADSSVTDIQFDLQGSVLPKDNGYVLYQELVRLLPWLETERLAGIHAIHGAATGEGELVRGQGDLILNRRTKLVIRLPKTRVADIAKLSGQTISVAGHSLQIGASKLRPITLHIPLYAHCVTTGSDDETIFAAEIIRLLDDMHIDCRFICGRQQTIMTADGPVPGYSLMLHGMGIEHAIKIQETGLGGHRKIGCGIFIPHKSIKAL